MTCFILPRNLANVINSARLMPLLLLGLLLSGAALAQPAPQPKDAFDTAQARRILDNLERRLAAKLLSAEDASQAIRQLTRLRTEANDCANDTSTNLERVRRAITATTAAEGEAAEEPKELTLQGEAAEALARRKERAAELEARLADCRLISLRSDELITDINDYQASLLRSELRIGGPTIYQLALDSLDNPSEWWTTTQDVVVAGLGTAQLARNELIMTGICAVLGLIVGLMLRKWFRGRVAMLRKRKGFVAQIRSALAASLGRFTPSLGFLAGIWVVLGWIFREVDPDPINYQIVTAWCLFLLGVVVLRSVFYPPPPAMQLTSMPDSMAKRIGRRSYWLLFIFMFSALIVGGLENLGVPQTQVLLVRATLALLIGINMILLIWLFGKIRALKGAAIPLRWILVAGCALALGAELTGYRNLSEFLLGGIFKTILTMIAMGFTLRALREVFDGLDEGKMPWQQRVRDRLNVADGEHFPGLFWIRLVLEASVLFGGLLLLMSAWRLSDAGLPVLSKYLVDGFSIGNTEIIPIKVVGGILVFALLVWLVNWLKGGMESRLTKRSRMDAGAREAVVAGIGYVGFIVALLMGLSTAGVDFSNLAIIAGALSVGIGFGLQAVVGNFVAGLIMLLERPVKPGDWIAVGATQGYVTKVRVRATEIRTFDRSEVLIPNSEFISSQVTNMTLRDSYGRLVVPVGVAYGSDVHKVRDILLEIARAHPQVVQGGQVPGPSVLFLAFADSSLNFELRCFIQNVNNKLSTLSEINFEIDRRFREEEVEIPFPQRDLHIRSDLPRWPDRADRRQPPPRKEPEPTPPPRDGEPSLTADA